MSNSCDNCKFGTSEEFGICYGDKCHGGPDAWEPIETCETCLHYSQCGGQVCNCGATCWGNPAHHVWDMVKEGNHYPFPEFVSIPKGGKCSSWKWDERI